MLERESARLHGVEHLDTAALAAEGGSTEVLERAGEDEREVVETERQCGGELGLECVEPLEECDRRGRARIPAEIVADDGAQVARVGGRVAGPRPGNRSGPRAPPPAPWPRVAAHRAGAAGARSLLPARRGPPRRASRSRVVRAGATRPRAAGDPSGRGRRRHAADLPRARGDRCAGLRGAIAPGSRKQVWTRARRALPARDPRKHPRGRAPARRVRAAADPRESGARADPVRPKRGSPGDGAECAERSRRAGGPAPRRRYARASPPARAAPGGSRLRPVPRREPPERAPAAALRRAEGRGVPRGGPDLRDAHADGR